MKRSPAPLDTVNQCTHCPHTIIALGTGFFCPCEDCHPGGLFQGREPKLLSPIERATNVVPFTPVTATPTESVNDGGDGWVDPMHTL